MEIEAKFDVPDERIARKLRKVQGAGEFTWSAPRRVTVRDTFYDTPEKNLTSTRHVLRLRRRNDGRAFFTFKAPAQRQVGYQIRPETEVEVALARTPRSLKASKVPLRIRKLVAPLAQGQILHPLFSISQTRETRLLRRGRRIIAEWSLDKVRFRSGDKKRAFYELEIELKKSGTEQDLRGIAEWVKHEFELETQPLGKFARAVEFMGGG